jgi:DNA invertase Pin-like site-specific DNA recombinase
MLPIGLYARVSTEDKDQNPENQLVPLRKWAIEQGKEYREYVDYESGKDIELTKREQFLAAFKDLETGVIEGLAVKRPDRFTRNRTDGGNFIKRIQKAGKYLYIYDRFLKVDKDTKKTTIALLGFEQQANELESALLSDRVKDAYKVLKEIADQKKERLRWGRRPLMAARKVIINLPNGKQREKLIYDVPIDKNKVIELRNRGKTYREIASELHISLTPIKTILFEAGLNGRN